MLEAIAQAQEFDLDMVTSLTHTFHAVTTPRCKFFQAIQNCFYERKRQCNGQE
jgi:hypothetical protein